MILASCHRLVSNEGRLWRQLVLPKRIDNWSLTSLQQRLVMMGGHLHIRARYLCHLTRRLIGRMARRIEALPVSAG